MMTATSGIVGLERDRRRRPAFRHQYIQPQLTERHGCRPSAGLQAASRRPSRFGCKSRPGECGGLQLLDVHCTISTHESGSASTPLATYGT
jgi:hypothetical protein